MQSLEGDAEVLLAQGQKLKNIKYSNYKIVFSILRQADNRSIGEIAHQIRLSNTAVSKIISALVEKDMIYSSGKGESTNEGGKRPELFSVNKDYKYAMVLRADTCKLKCGIYDIYCNERCSVDRECSENTSYSEYLDICADAMEEALQKMQISAEKLLGCCIASPGIIDTAAGIVVYPVWSPAWGRNLNFCEDLRKRLPFQLDLIIENNSRMVSYAQFSELAGREQHGSYVAIYSSDDDQCVTPGIGGCIINDNRIRRGTNGYAGEFGHITVDHNDPEPCVCGRKGCLQTVTAPRRMVAYAYERREKYPDSIIWEIEKQRPVVLKDIIKASNQNDPLSMEVVDIAVEYYARGIESIILTIDPEYILLSGGYNGGTYFLNRLNERIHNAGLFGSANGLHIQYAKYDMDMAMLIGSAMYLFDLYFNDEQTYIGSK